MKKYLLGIGAAVLLTASQASAAPMMADVSPDGAKYGLSWTIVGNVYTFTFTADFTDVTATPPVGTYAAAFSIASIPGDVDWSAGTISEAPGSESNWSIYTGVVTSNAGGGAGCPAAGADSKDWCVGLNTPGTNDAPAIAQGSILTFKHTMTLASGAPDFDGPDKWSYKFITTTGNVISVGGGPNAHNEWEYGSYQISRELAACTSTTVPGCGGGNGGGGGSNMPEPTSMVLMGLGLVGVASRIRRR